MKRIPVTMALAAATTLTSVALTASPAAASPNPVEFGNWPSSAVAGPNSPSSRLAPVEVSPPKCPTKVKKKFVRIPGKISDICRSAVRGASSKYAKKALRYTFAHLGAPYTSKGIGRDSAAPHIFDCSSLIGRAYNAAGAVIYNKQLGYSVPLYPLFSYTGAYLPETYGPTNLVRIKRKQLKPGDFSIQFNGPDPSKSGGAAGHAQLYVGRGIVAQSTPAGPGALSIWPANNGLSKAWYFRVKETQPNPPAAVLPNVGGVFFSEAAELGHKEYLGSLATLRTALLQTEYATEELKLELETKTYTPAMAESVKLLQASMGYQSWLVTGLLDPYSAAKLGLTWSTG